MIKNLKKVDERKAELISAIKAHAEKYAVEGVYYESFCHEYGDTGMRDTTTEETIVIKNDCVYFLPYKWNISAETMIEHCRNVGDSYDMIFGNGFMEKCEIFKGLKVGDSATEEEWFNRYDENKEAVHEFIEKPENKQELTDLCAEILVVDEVECTPLTDMSIEDLEYIVDWILNLN